MTFEKVVVVDGRDHLLGRLAGLVAKELVLGQRVVVVRCEELMQSGPSWRNVIKVQKERVKKVGPRDATGSEGACLGCWQGWAGAAARPAATSACPAPCRARPGRAVPG